MEKRCTPVKLHFEHYIPDKYDPYLSPIIFVHAIADTGKTWRKLMPTIADETRRQAYAIDLRNHGKSEWSDDFTHESLCLDILNFMEKNEIKKCIFVSHSLGARVCMSICLRKPEIVEKIVIEDARLGHATNEEAELVSGLAMLVRGIGFFPKTMKEKELRSFLSKQAKAIFPQAPEVADFIYYIPGYQDTAGNFHLSINFKAIERSIKDKSLLTLDLDGCQNYTGPALVMCGDKSAMQVDKDELLPRYFPNAEFCHFENTGHYLHRQEMEKFTTKVCDFIGS